MCGRRTCPRFVDRIFEETGRLIALVEDIIKLSRLDEDSELPREAVDLYELAKKEAKNAEPQAEKKNVLITVRGESTVINGVVQVLSEMVRNLIDNAVKYNRDDGRVDIGVYCSGSYAVLSVTDTGIGIPRSSRTGCSSGSTGWIRAIPRRPGARASGFPSSSTARSSITLK